MSKQTYFGTLLLIVLSLALLFVFVFDHHNRISVLEKTINIQKNETYFFGEPETNYYSGEIQKLHTRIDQLECDHPGFFYHIDEYYMVSDGKISAYTKAHKRCGLCDKIFNITEDEYFQAMKDAATEKRIFYQDCNE